MPAPNDLTPEEEAEFAQHGVASSGGVTITQDDDTTGAVPGNHGDRTGQETGDHGDRTAPVVQERPRDAQGRFLKQDGTVDENQNPTPSAPEQVQTPPPPGFVPHQALHEARQREAQMRQQFAQLQARTNALLQSRQQETPTALPDIEQDPRGFVESLAERMEQFQAEQQAAQQNQQVDTLLGQDEQAFKSYTPDYDHAAEYFVTMRARELAMFYPPDKIVPMMQAEARQIAQKAWAQGMPAGQAIYQMSQARGWRPGLDGQGNPLQQQQEQANVQQQNGQQNGAAKVAQVKNAQAQTRTLSNTGGGSPAELNAEALLNMSDEDFEKYLKLGSKGANQRFASIG